ncbi:unnamed protein product [Schistosoma intercalatum]|nr:unnamed protein product [Schistosoma intercalatum]
MLVHNRLLFNEMSSVRKIQLSSEQQTIMNCDSKFNDSFWSEVFKTVDKNHDGRINKKEFKKFMLTNGGKFTASDIKKIFAYCDTDNSGYIDFLEFKNFMEGR